MKTKIGPPPPALVAPDPNGGFCGPQMARKHNRPPAWRWDYACTLVRCDKQPFDDDDAWVRKAFDLRRHQLGVPGVPKPTSGLAAAYELYTTTESFRRWVVEARFVAQQSVREVAAATGVPQVTLRAYEKLFFDVAGPNGDYPAVRTNVILPLQVRDVGPVDVERALKVFAFKGGPHVLDRAIEYFTTAPPAPPLGADELDPDALERWYRRLVVQLAVEVECLPPSQITKVVPLQHLVDRLKARLVEMGRLGATKSPSGAPIGR